MASPPPQEQASAGTSLQALMLEALQPQPSTTSRPPPAETLTLRPSMADISMLQNNDHEDQHNIDPALMDLDEQDTMNDISSPLSSPLDLPVIRAPANKPAQDEEFYAKMHRNERNLAWYAPRIRDALGVTQETYNIILATAHEILPGDDAVNFRNGDYRSVRDKAATQLAEHPSMRQFLIKSFSIQDYPEAASFFEKVPVKLIMAANDARRSRPTSDRSSLKRTFEEADLEDSSMSVEDGFITSSAKPPRVVKRSSRLSALTAMQRLKEGQQAAEAAEAEFSAESIPTTTPYSTIRALVAPRTTPQDDQLTLMSNNTQSPFRQNTTLPYTLQIESKNHDHVLPVGLSDLFSPCHALLRVENMTLSPIRDRYNIFRKRYGLQEIGNEDAWFKFVWVEDNGKENSLDVFDDASLRYAYRIWLTGEQLFSPFVLYVDED